ncbi:hypothetical protein DXD25_00645 [Prevotella sp. TF12-30]|nr:hypothetical protein DXD25_00645 [Prevotella sp. TF12-30]
MWSSPCRRDGEVEKTLIILISKQVLLNQYPGKNTLKAILIWQGLYVLNFRYEPIVLLEIVKKMFNINLTYLSGVILNNKKWICIKKK